ncbi:chemotaxis protein CheW [Paraburkholderia acidisoli]|uniref:Chemotaxis protein CheW n=1 Tax=Paraburkholderia acidisoli TaxID=2571748 RepID=A0A7Z2JJK7_9BURK|nr:chemotaxis protein CheW [Paraburkholderia acidisoli]QGZ66891.1 chemotaxis protein CheW [Paraburkholderia acidisoli]
MTETGGTTLDTCWTTIGVRGDNSCPRLQQYVRCLNCPVFEQAAAGMLDRPAPAMETRVAAAPAPKSGQARGAGSLVFRVGAEWLALPAAVLRHVEDARSVHTLPHRRSAAVLGIVNVRGVLTLAASLAALLHIERAAREGTSANDRPRLLVTEWAGATTAFPVDEVEGVVAFAAEELLPAPATLAQSASRHVRGVVTWRGRSVGVLDADALFESLARNLR